MTVTPISEFQPTMPEAGRIRLGVRGDRGPRSLRTLRFTSTNETAIAEIATLYGGTVKPWTPRGQRSEFEVVTQASAVPIILPPNPLGGGSIYELWSAGGLVRRCDGLTASVQRSTPDGAEWGEVPCVCDAADDMTCEVTTHLVVILPEIRFGGAWRLTTHSWYASKELPGMVQAIQALQAQGFSRAVLAVDPRTETKDGQTHNFVVPVLRSEHSVNEIVEGQGALGALAQVPRPAALPPPPLLDDQVAEAILVEDEDEDEDDEHDEAEELVVERAPDHRPIAGPSRIAIRCKDLGLSDDDRHAFALTVSDGRTSSTRDLTDDEIDRVLIALRKIERGEVQFTRAADGRVSLKRRTTRG